MSINAIEAVLLLGLAPTAAGTASASLCRISDTLYLNDSPVSGATVSAALSSPPGESGSWQLSAGAEETTTDATGAWHLDLVRGLSYRLRIPAAAVNSLVTVPAQATATLRDLI